jgi:hypothetical protein
VKNCLAQNWFTATVGSARNGKAYGRSDGAARWGINPAPGAQELAKLHI